MRASRTKFRYRPIAIGLPVMAIVLTLMSVVGFSLVASSKHLGAAFKQPLYAAGADDKAIGSSAASLQTSNSLRTTLRLDPKFTLQQVLHGSAPSDYARFGGAVALSSDGNTALIGTEEQNSFEGGAYVFNRVDGNWAQQQKLTPSESDAPMAQNFGYAAALSDDAKTAFVRGRNAIYIFARAGATWAEQGKLRISGVVNSDNSDSSMALSSDGNTALVAAFGLSDNTRNVSVFTRTGASWNQEQNLPASNGANDSYFDGSVALASDGNTALAGARDGLARYMCSAYREVFARSFDR